MQVAYSRGSPVTGERNFPEHFLFRSLAVRLPGGAEHAFRYQHAALHDTPSCPLHGDAAHLLSTHPGTRRIVMYGTISLGFT